MGNRADCSQLRADYLENMLMRRQRSTWEQSDGWGNAIDWAKLAGCLSTIERSARQVADGDELLGTTQFAQDFTPIAPRLLLGANGPSFTWKMCINLNENGRRADHGERHWP